MAFLTSKALPRRTVLRGLGATLALPFLDAMLPAASLRARAAGAPVQRFQTFYVPNAGIVELRRDPRGWVLESWETGERVRGDVTAGDAPA